MKAVILGVTLYEGCDFRCDTFRQPSRLASYTNRFLTHTRRYRKATRLSVFPEILLSEVLGEHSVGV